jgi:aspartyl-tRNA(Asn)/glutamyl-tRNA(Gln) amidotransferase subunit A
MDIRYLDMDTLAQYYRAGKLSPVEVVKTLLGHIENENPRINAFITVLEDEALLQAREAEADFRSGNIRGPLQGIPIGLKDLFYTKGIRTTMGSQIYQNYIPDHDATAVQALKQAGAIIIGKLNTHQFAYGPTGDRSFFGPVRNPHNTNHMTGGSSSGSAASVASGMCYGALGTDTSASIRLPAALCGIVGMKPTLGRVSKYGVFPLSSTLDHVGPMTRGIRDNAILLGTIATPLNENYGRHIGESIRGLKIGIPDSYYFEYLHPEVEARMDSVISLLQSSGAAIQKVKLKGIQDIFQAQQTILKYEAFQVHRKHLMEIPEQYDDEVRTRLMTGAETTAQEYADALQYKEQADGAFREAFEEVDVILTPTVGMTAPVIGEREPVINGEKMVLRWLMTRLTAPTNFVGSPSLSVPCGNSQSGLPIGVQLIGKWFDEATLYRVGYAIEHEMKGVV